MTLPGLAIHACIAAAMTDANAPLSYEEVGNILAGYGVGEVMSAQAVLDQMVAFERWITQRWPEAKRRAEIPVETIMATGQIMQGRIDLLLETRDGWILLDHKSNPQGRDLWADRVDQYAGQMLAYQNAIETASGKPVLEIWLYFPVAGGAVKISNFLPQILY
jgi:ATP-dependent exoDNAse (exonuclease V) beta subunit